MVDAFRIMRHKMKTSHCKSCGAEIIWAKTKNGKAIPIDAEPCKDGNISLYNEMAIVMDMREIAFYDGPLYTSHFVTCPQADEYRSKKS
jgi:hypothetical protein